MKHLAMVGAGVVTVFPWDTAAGRLRMTAAPPGSACERPPAWYGQALGCESNSLAHSRRNHRRCRRCARSRRSHI